MFRQWRSSAGAAALARAAYAVRTAGELRAEIDAGAWNVLEPDAALVMGRIAFIVVSKESPPPANPHPEGGLVVLAIHRASFE